MSREVDEALRKWADKTPALAAIKGTGERPQSAEGGAKKAKGGDKAAAGKKK